MKDKHTNLLAALEAHTSSSLAFRPLARSDGWPLFVATRNPEFNRFLLWNAPDDIHKLMPQVEKLLRDHNLKNMVALSLVERDDGVWRGMAIIKPFREGMEMSLYLHPSSWNKGHVLSSGCAIIELIRKADPNMPIYNRVKTGNRKMARLNTTYGFEVVDRMDEPHADGSLWDLDVYRLDPSKWQPFTKIAAY